MTDQILPSKVVGHIENISQNSIGGWVHDQNSTQPLTIDIFANGIHIKSLRADKFRSDLTSIRSDGCIGFEMRIAPSLLKVLPPTTHLSAKVGSKTLPYLYSITGQAKDSGELKKALDRGMSVNKNGELILPISDRGQHWGAHAVRDFCGISHIFESLFGKRLALAYGSLLGCIREGDVIGHDDDLDALFLSEHSDSKEVARELHEVVRILNKETDHKAIALNNGQIQIQIRNGILLDVFFGWFDDQGFNLYFSIAGVQLEPNDFSPMKIVEFKGHEVVVPKESEKVLAAIYGENWRTPDPMFQWRISPETEAFFKDYDSIKFNSKDNKA